MIFQEVSHLYPNVQVLFPNGKKDYVRVQTELSVSDGHFNIKGSYTWHDKKEVKPILRRITSMTQIEAQEVFAICYEQVYSYQPTEVKFWELTTNGNVVGLRSDEVKHGGGKWNYGFTICKENIEFSVDGRFMSISVLPVYVYLLSKHFDLFDFIEDGKAIEQK